MGQTLSLAALPSQSIGLDVPEFADLVFEKPLGNARFMKSVRARQQNGVVVVKIVMKPSANVDLSPYARALRAERKALQDVPNAFAYSRIIETNTNGYLVRQFFSSSLYDRLSTRPFLEEIEKQWLAFQLLCAVKDIHAREIYHGDIKAENVVVTSWNWLYLTDFSSCYKPTYLPEDNPAAFSYFFDASGRRTCYLAPERFDNETAASARNRVTWAMDIFSAGCVIAEVFVEAPIFTLSQMFQYKAGKYDPVHIQKISNHEIRALVTHMIQLRPDSRYFADEYLNFWRRKTFPDYFYTFLHQYLGSLTDPSAGRLAVLPRTANFGDSDERIHKVYSDLDKISSILDLESDDGSLIFANLITSQLRHAARSTARLQACDLLSTFSARITDEAKMDRILPYLVALLSDSTVYVQVAALRAIVQILSAVKTASPSNFQIFNDFLKPRLHHLMLHPAKNILRAELGASLGPLVEAANRFLALTCGYEEREDFDAAKTALQEFFDFAARKFLTDKDKMVRNAVLSSIPSLCVFLGPARVSDAILSHLNTYLNDPDWALKCNFFRTIVGVATFIGSPGLEAFILPLILQSLGNNEDFVICTALLSAASLAETKILPPRCIWDLVRSSAPFLIHPNAWLRQAAVHFIVATAQSTPSADHHCYLLPLLRPFLVSTDLTTIGLLQEIRKPISWPVFDLVLQWSTLRKSRFWSLSKVEQLDANTTNREDRQWLQKLRAIGLSTEGETSIVALREHILQRKSRPTSPTRIDTVVLLKDLQVTPCTVFFHKSASTSRATSSPNRTITEALSEAQEVHDSVDVKTLMTRRVVSKTMPKTSATATTVSGDLQPTNQAHGHSFEGSDPGIVRLLNTLSKHQGPQKMHDLGPFIDSFSKSWTPVHRLIAVFAEHTAAITNLVVAPDHSFFLSCSLDGSVKIWDTARLERSLVHHSMHTYTYSAKILALCMLQNSHCFAFAAADGMLQVVRVVKGRTYRTHVLRHCRLAPREHGTAFSQTGDLLLIVTNKSQILALHIADLSCAFAMENPVQHGVPRCLCVGNTGDWLIVGTSLGYLDVWDLRFRLQLNSLRLKDGLPIRHVAPSTSREVFITTANLSGIWNIETCECRQAFCLEASSSHQALSRRIEMVSAKEPVTTAMASPGISATAMVSEHSIVAGGADSILRYWNIEDVYKSTIISSPKGEARAEFSVVRPSPRTAVHQEVQLPKELNAPGEDGHLDEICSVCTLMRPFSMIVSADRMGRIHVYA